jgi:hypothetical protein
MPNNCVFESKYETNDKKIVTLQRWDFNKAFFNEVHSVPLGYDHYDVFLVPGDKGFFHKEFCQDKKCSSGEREEIMTLNILDDRRMKALQYFVSNFCPGTKRKSAF